MKSIKLILVMAALLLGGSAARAALDFPSVPTYTPGKSSQLTVGATTPGGASAMQFTVTLPDGFTLTSTTVTLDKSRATDHTYRMNKVSDSSYKCVIYSSSNTPFATSECSLFSLPLKAASDAAKGGYELKFTEITSADASGKETPMPDASVTLPVVILATSVRIEPSTVSLKVGEEVRLSAVVTPAEADQTVTWKPYNSSASGIISVSSDGVVRGLARGSARVVATTADGTGRTATCTVNVSDVAVSELVMSRESMDLRLGSTGRLTVTVKPDNATNQGVTWSSSATSVLTVDSDGNLTPRSVGTATVTATAADGSGVKATCRVNVLAPLVSAIALDQAALSLRVDETARLAATISPSGASRQLTWTSTDAGVATVDASGTVTARTVGEAVITAAATDGSGVKAECRVTVGAALVSSVTLSRSSVDLLLGESVSLSADVLPDYAGNRTLVWTTSDSSVATVDQSGRIEAAGVGTAVITATSTDGSDKSGRCEVRVSRPTATWVTISSEELTLRMGETARLSATVTPSTASQTVTWSSSAPDIVSVDASGNLTALAKGTAFITVAVPDVSGLWDVCRVTVTAPLTTAITLSPASLSLRVNDKAMLTAISSPEEASFRYIWSSSHEEVASVDIAGMVTARSVGETVITVAATDGSGVEAQCRVTVGAALVSSITLDRTSVELRPGESETLTATVLPDNAANRTVAWTTSDATVATVDQNGRVEAVATGDAVITVLATDGSGVEARCRVTVMEPLAKGIELDRSEVTLNVSETVTVTARVIPDEASQTVGWESSDTSVASVNADGEVTALSEGLAIITVSTLDGTGLTAACIVNVTDKSGIVAAGSGTGVSVTADGRDIVIAGASADDIIRVVDASGIMVYQGRDRRIAGLSAGFHLVMVDSVAYKVIIR